MEIQRLDWNDVATADAWYEVYTRAARADLPSAVPWLRSHIADQYGASLRADGSAWAGIVADRVVCVGMLELPLLDNRHSAALDVYTDPGQRRKGYGSAMATHLERIASAAGRQVTHVDMEYPLSVPVDGAGWPGVEFAVAHGYAFGLGEFMRSMVVPVAPDRLAELADSARPHHRDYRLEAFEGRVPEEWVADFVALGSRIATDSPTGTLDLEPGSTEIAPFRETEARMLRQGRRIYGAVAVHGERVVGFTQVSVSPEESELGEQFGTLVDASHRGHRLGLALKVANLRQVQQREPQLASIITWNAGENEPMVAVNDQLGFVPVHRGGGFEKRW